MIGRHLAHLDDYLAEKAAVEKMVRDLAMQHGFSRCDVSVNAADDPSSGSIYLTVTGMSAEAGDDDEVGRGNRVNGLITPCRPMSLEATAGKNPVAHVGKIYNVAARNIAETLIATVPGIARCVEDTVADRLSRVQKLIDDFVAGTIGKRRRQTLLSTYSDLGERPKPARAS